VLVAWSVTITDPRFWWSLEDATFGMVEGKLGRVTFSELLAWQTGKYASSGARSGVYAEAAYFGSPGAYQMYIFMHNEEGIGKFTPSGSSDVRVGDFKWHDDREDHPAINDAATRAEITVNTVGDGRKVSHCDGGEVAHFSTIADRTR
jgi:hypothetical protein